MVRERVIRVQLDRSPVRTVGHREIEQRLGDARDRNLRVGKVGSEFQRPPRTRVGERESRLPLGIRSLEAQDVRLAQRRVRLGELRVELDGPLEGHDGRNDPSGVTRRHLPPAELERLPRREATRRPMRNRQLRISGEPRRQGGGHGSDDLVLHLEQALRRQLAIDAPRPQVFLRAGVDELQVHAQAPCLALHAALEQASYAEQTADLAGIAATVAELLDRRAGNHPQRWNLRQPGQQIVMETVGEQAILGPAAEVLKGQDGDRGPSHCPFHVGQRRTTERRRVGVMPG